jgi:KDO2-lipid IV(A) lauroyltransferase
MANNRPSTIKDFIAYILAITFIKFLGALPRRVALSLAKFIATVAFYVDGRHRRVMMKNIGVALPQLNETETRRIARAAFRNIGRLAVEVSKFPSLTRDNIARLVTYDAVDGADNFQRAYKKGKGVLFLTGHFSSWELLPFAHALYGHPLKFIVRPLDSALFDKFFNTYRSLSGNVPIPKRNSLRQVLESLRAGEGVGILIDQNVQASEGVFVDFFGRPACTTTSLAVLALRTGAPVVPGYLVRNPDRETYRMVFYREVELIRTGNRERDILENTQRFTKVIEDIVRKHPDQWLWGHRRWKTRPDHDPDSIY